MIKKLLLLIIAFVFTNTIIFSKEISIQKARTVAVSFLTEQDFTIHQIENPNIFQKNGTKLFYTFKLKQGFIIVSADDKAFPVLGYSFENNFDINNPPPAFSFWMSQYETLLKSQIETPDYISIAWTRYLFGNVKPLNSKEGVTPLISTTWDQGEFYNSAFPVDSNFNSNHPYAGCVAIAISQIMKFYNWPETGKDENTIGSPYGDLTANFGDATYNWVEMENFLVKENEAVAELIYHSAIGVNSLFFPQGTGAYDYNIPPALIDYFRYKETAEFILKDNYSGDWEEMIRHELENGRPLIYGAADLQNSAGHTFICDGYQEDSFFHFNWGWNGLYNGYFYLDSLMVAGYHFDFQHDVVIGIKPDISGITEIYPPENLIAEVEYHDVHLSWDPPTITGTLDLLGYNIFRNDSLLNESISTLTSYIDFDVPLGNHTYRVNTAYIGNGLGRSIETEVSVNSIQEIATQLFKIYPNPTPGYLNIIVVNKQIKNLEIELFDLKGNKVLETYLFNLSSDEIRINTGNLQGAYILNLKSANYSTTKRVIIY